MIRGISGFGGYSNFGTNRPYPSKMSGGNQFIEFFTDKMNQMINQKSIAYPQNSEA